MIVLVVVDWFVGLVVFGFIRFVGSLLAWVCLLVCTGLGRFDYC